jgi:hypothetical protein
MINEPQTIDLQYAGKRHFFRVYRFTTDQELIDAMHADKITDPDAYQKDILAYTDNYPTGEECGRMYLLDKSVNTLAHEAVHIANGILARHGYKSLESTTDKAPQLEEDFCDLVGTITSELYSKSKHF